MTTPPEVEQTGDVDVVTIRRRLVIQGRLQGVRFRVSCREKAEWHGVSGWVRNLDGGMIEVVAEGEPEAVDPFVEWCRVGPRRADVTGVDTAEEEPQGESGFRVLR